LSLRQRGGRRLPGGLRCTLLGSLSLKSVNCASQHGCNGDRRLRCRPWPTRAIVMNESFSECIYEHLGTSAGSTRHTIEMHLGPRENATHQLLVAYGSPVTHRQRGPGVAARHVGTNHR